MVVGFEGVETLYDRRDNHCQHEADARVEDGEGEFEALGPTDVGVGGAEDALREDKIDDE